MADVCSVTLRVTRHQEDHLLPDLHGPWAAEPADNEGPLCGFLANQFADSVASHVAITQVLSVPSLLGVIMSLL